MPSSPFLRAASALFFVISGMLLGFVLGGMLGGRVFGSGVGFDRLADALGGMMIGTVLAAFLALLAVRRLTPQQRWVGGLAACLGAALILAGLAWAGPTNRQATVASREGLPSAVLALESCRLDGVRGSARCGTFAVPEDRKSGSGRKLDLNLVVLPATGRKTAADPVVFLNGGPGASATALAPVFAVSGLRSSRDIILVDQRGTGGSNPLNCDVNSLTTQLKLLTSFEVPQLAACRDDLDAELPLYTTPAAIEDLEDVRKALGFSTVNLLSGSYGTRVALEYLRRYPESVRSAVLLGVAPPEFHVAANFAPDSQQAFDRVLEDCRRDRDCNRAFPRPREELDATLQRLKAKPEQARIRDPFSGGRVTVTVTRELLAGLVHYSLYSSSGASRLPAGIRAAFEGDHTPLLEQFAQLAAAVAPMMSDGAFLSAVCSEDVPFFDADVIATHAKGTVLGPTLAKSLIRMCAAWPHVPAAKAFKQPVTSDVPVLLLSGAADPVTPPKNAEAALRHLSAGRHVVFPEGGHSELSVGCTLDLIRDFIERGTTEGLDVSCAEQQRRPAFRLQR